MPARGARGASAHSRVPQPGPPRPLGLDHTCLADPRAPLQAPPQDEATTVPHDPSRGSKGNACRCVGTAWPAPTARREERSILPGPGRPQSTREARRARPCGHQGSARLRLHRPWKILEQRYGQVCLVPVLLLVLSVTGRGREQACAALSHQHPGYQHRTCTNRGLKATAARNEAPGPSPSPLTPAKPSRPRTSRPALQIRPPGPQRERGGHLPSFQASRRPGAKASATLLGRRAHWHPGPASAVTAFPLAAPCRCRQPRAGERHRAFQTCRRKGCPTGFRSSARHRPQPQAAAPPRPTPLTLSFHWRWETRLRAGPLPAPPSCCLAGSAA